MHLAQVVRDRPSDARRDIIVEHMRKVIIGDTHLTGRFFHHLVGLPMSGAEQEQLPLA